MNRVELGNEIKRVETALRKTKSEKLTRDYSKYLLRLKREARDYDKFMRGTTYGKTKNRNR